MGDSCSFGGFSGFRKVWARFGWGNGGPLRGFPYIGEKPSFMDLPNQEVQLKDALKHALLELLTERRELFIDLVREVLSSEAVEGYDLSQMDPQPAAEGGRVLPIIRARRTALAMNFKAGLADRTPYDPAPDDWYEQ